MKPREIRIPSWGVLMLLLVLYVIAVWLRASSVGPVKYPYYKGESGTNYRHAQLVTQENGFPRLDKRGSWPEGYSPSAVKANGVEFAAGQLYRVVDYFSDAGLREYVAVLTILFFSLSVMTFYSLANRLWTCQGAGFFAAFLVAFSRPVVEATNGRSFDHLPFAIVLVSLHLALYLSYLDRPSLRRALAASLAVFALAASWEAAPVYAALFALLCLSGRGLGDGDRKKILMFHSAALLLAGLAVPHLAAQRYLFSGEFSIVVSALAYFFVARSLPVRIPRIAYVIFGAAILAAALRPIQAGGVDSLSGIEYWLYRLRYVFGKPDDPQTLPPGVRFLWTHARSFPPSSSILAFCFPLVFLVPAVIGGLRLARKQTTAPAVLAVLFAAVTTVAFLMDRRFAVLAAIGVFPLAGVSMYAFGRHFMRRAVFVAAAVFLTLTAGVWPHSGADLAYRVASRAGTAPKRGDGFLRVSIGNADEELVRFVVSRTSVRDPFATPGETASMLSTFAGRKTLYMPGILTRHMMAKTLEFTSRIYGSEDALLAACDSLGVKYLVYSIDYLLDSTKDSPRYAAGLGSIGEGSVVRTLHFFPERLRYFHLVYENDVYRVYHVSRERRPMFITDHPPVYQYEILKRHGDTLTTFYNRVTDILTTYRTAVSAQERGDEEQAIRRFRYCLDRAPHFTLAWLGIGDSLFRLGDVSGAHRAYMTVVAYAPDNLQALYHGALTAGRLGERDKAIGLVDVLLGSTNNPEMRKQARELKATLERVAPRGGAGERP